MTLYSWTDPRWNPFAIRWQRHSAGPAFTRLRPTFHYRGHTLPAFVYDGPPPTGHAVAEARYGTTAISDLIPVQDLPPITRTVLVGETGLDYDPLARLLAGAGALLVCYLNRVVSVDGTRRPLSAVVDEFSANMTPIHGPQTLRVHTVHGYQAIRTAIEALSGPAGEHLTMISGAVASDLAAFGDVLVALDTATGERYDRLAELVRRRDRLIIRAFRTSGHDAPAIELLSASRQEFQTWKRLGARIVDDPRDLPGGAIAQLQETRVGDVVPVGAYEGALELDLSGTGVLALDDLPDFPLVRELSLDGRTIIDLAPIAAADDLRSLSMLGVKVDSLRPLQALPRLAQLRLDRQPFDGLALDGLPGLRRLDLGTMPVTSLDFLADVPDLEELSIEADHHAGIDLQPISHLRQLQRLALRTPAVTDLSQVAQLQQLTALDVSGTRPGSLEPLSKLQSLKLLRLIGVDADLSPVAHLTQLRTLGLDQTDIKDLTLLTPLAALRDLGLSFTPVTDLTPLLKLPHLATVDVTGTNADTTPLEQRGIHIERRL